MPAARFCPTHGSPLFDVCPSCGELWRIIRKGDAGRGPQDFCSMCGHPGQWISRRDRVQWLKDRLDDDLDEATALELRELLDRLAQMDPNDARATAAWEKLKHTAPKLWRFGKPVIQGVIGEAIKKALGF
jgi:hypothetical protein